MGECSAPLTDWLGPHTECSLFVHMFGGLLASTEGPTDWHEQNSAWFDRSSCYLVMLHRYSIESRRIHPALCLPVMLVDIFNDTKYVPAGMALVVCTIQPIQWKCWHCCIRITRTIRNTSFHLVRENVWRARWRNENGRRLVGWLQQRGPHQTPGHNHSCDAL